MCRFDWSFVGKARALFCCLACLCLPAKLPADTVFPNILLEGTYDIGAAVNEALLVVDFWPGNATGDSFAFRVRFGSTPGDTITGFDLLTAVQAGTNEAFWFDWDDYGEMGKFVSAMEYTDRWGNYYQSKDWPDGWLSYWNSDSPSLAWTSNISGVSFRTLNHGYADGWLAAPVPDDWNPDTWPQPVVPRPGTVGQWVAASSGPADWGDPANWLDGVPQALGHRAAFGSSNGNGTTTVQLNGNRTLSALAFQNTQGGSYTIQPGSGGVLTLDNGTAAVPVTVTAGSHIIAAQVLLQSNAEVNTADGTNLTFSAAISGAGKSLRKSGAGMLTLSAAPAYTGNTTVAAGTLVYDIASGLPVVVPGTTLMIEAGASVIAAGDVDPFTDGTTPTQHVSVINHSQTGGLKIIAGDKELASLTGEGTITISAGATLTAAYVRQDSLQLLGTQGAPAKLIIRPSGTQLMLGDHSAMQLSRHGSQVPEPGAVAMLIAAAAAAVIWLAAPTGRKHCGPDSSRRQ